MAAESTPHSSFSSSSSSSPPRWNHDVFLSFRGEDTRKNFTDHLYTALVQAGIHTFRDDDELPRGKEISIELLKSIEESRISIIVFSKNYASSRWCLEELVKILECRKTMGQLVLPLFYNVDPSDVSKQTGSFGEYFARHEERFATGMEKVEKWRAALTEAANLSGWDLQNVANGHESKFIHKIVEKVLHQVNHTFLNVAVHPVGMEDHVQYVNSLLSLGSNDVRMIGIYGMGGIGKTAIAKAVYNLFFQHFECSYFLANVREVSEQNGVVYLQEQLLSQIIMIKTIKIDNVDRGSSLIKQRLGSKRVLIVLDDLDNLSQVNALAGQHNWFGSGSRVIITTRDEHLLNQAKVDGRYKIEGLNHRDSLELLSWHAFRNTVPLEIYVELSRGIVSYAEGLPLALEVLGSYLFKRTVEEWKSAFEKLQQIPHNQIQEKLRISFDALDDDKVKDFFLDIAFFFIGMEKDCAINILDACGFFSEIGIKVLRERCLLNIDGENKLRMHDLVRDMGREIVRSESPKESGRRSRLWFYDDVCNVLEKHKGTEAIEGISSVMPMLKDRHFNAKAFARMDKLRMLQINYVHLTGSFEHLSNELRWLCWQYCPFKYLPSDFHLKNLVTLDLRHSDCLTKTPDFTKLPSLVTLLLEGCISLFKVHQSIGHLKRLSYLNLKDCKNLRELPSSICKLRSLEHLNLSGCSNLDRFPEQLGNMVCLREILADGTSITQIPFAFELLKNLTHFSLKGCNRSLPTRSWLPLISSWVLPSKSPNSMRFLPPSISGLHSLIMLNLSDCNLFEEDIPVDLGSLSSLESLNLGRNNFRSLPSSIRHLSKLRTLSVYKCTSLQSLPEFPPNLEILAANECTSLEKLENMSNFKKLPIMWLSNCSRLATIHGLENIKSVHHIQGQPEHISSIVIQCSEVPAWFSHQTVESSISFDIPPHVEHTFRGMVFWIVYATKVLELPTVVVKDKTNGIEWTLKLMMYYAGIMTEEQSWVSRIPNIYFKNTIKGGEKMEVSFRYYGPQVDVKKWGIHVVYKPEFKEEEQSSCVSADVDGDELMDSVKQKRGRDVNIVETSRNSSNEEKCSKRLKMEPDSTTYLETEWVDKVQRKRGSYIDVLETSLHSSCEEIFYQDTHHRTRIRYLETELVDKVQ